MFQSKSKKLQKIRKVIDVKWDTRNQINIYKKNACILWINVQNELVHRMKKTIDQPEPEFSRICVVYFNVVKTFDR